MEQLSRDLQMRLYRTSVKEDLNVGSVFQHLAENYVESVGGGFSEEDFLVGVAGGGGGGGGGRLPPICSPYSEAYLATTMQVISGSTY